ncbi:MAG: rod shape-determining protein RodA [Bacteroidales bacterium]|jgi:rod shape determining protein RodA|nr:rod shape-determining protein RodA [Bacteroidales bacterium]
MSRKSFFVKIDWTLITIYLLLVITGVVNIYAAVYNPEANAVFATDTRYFKQLIWIFAALIIAVFVLVIDPAFFARNSYIIYGVFILLLCAVLVIGTATKGAKSWFGVGEFGIQPSEFAKMATALALARFISRTDFIRNTKNMLITLFIIVFPLLLVLLQNDTGSALVYIAFVLPLYREGLSRYVLIMGFALIGLFICALLVNIWLLLTVFLFITLLIWGIGKRIRRLNFKFKYLLWIFLGVACITGLTKVAYEYVLQPHQKDRIEVLLGQKVDNKGVGYNVNQSKIAIGSGGFWGKGFLNGTQTKYNFVPEQDTDFIFCTIGEEWGFVGAFIVVGLYMLLIIRIINKAERQRSGFARIYGYCVSSILFFHILINIGMTIGLLPVIGIPLPFISYGGSSLWAFTLLVFIFIRQDAQRTELV